MSFCVPAAASYGELVLAQGPRERRNTAATACEVVLLPEEADVGWQEATRDLRAWLIESAGRNVDCGGIEIRAGAPHPSIVFTTGDGRRAERPVSNASQLLAVVEALTFTIPEPSPQPAPALAATPPDDRPRTVAPHAIEPTSAHVLIDGRGGMRLPGAAPCFSAPAARSCTFAALSFAFGVGVNVGRWDLHVFGEYEPAHMLLAGSIPAGFAMSSYAVGLWAGRRHPMGPLDAVAGLTAAIAVTDETSQDQSGQAGGPSTAEPRLGLFAGVVVPRRGRVRARPELAADLVASRIGQPYRVDSTDLGLPLLPWWSVSASVGIEWEAP